MLKHAVMWRRRDETVAGILFENKRENEMVSVAVRGRSYMQISVHQIVFHMFGFSDADGEKG